MNESCSGSLVHIVTRSIADKWPRCRVYGGRRAGVLQCVAVCCSVFYSWQMTKSRLSSQLVNYPFARDAWVVLHIWTSQVSNMNESCCPMNEPWWTRRRVCGSWSPHSFACVTWLIRPYVVMSDETPTSIFDKYCQDSFMWKWILIGFTRQWMNLVKILAWILPRIVPIHSYEWYLTSVLQCVAVCWMCVAVCCSVLHV